MKRCHLIRALAVLSIFFVIAQAQAQDKKMYSWTDENGTVHFSDSRPEGQQATEQAIPASDQPASASPYSNADTGPSMAEQKRQQIAQKHQDAKANQAINDAQCAAWKSEVERLEPNRRVFTTNDQGETERMDDVKRTDRVAELKGLIAKNCK
ncbi:MAG: DUF4124 domain-containing protein [Xanthomonadales bacterium]|nr:DUF4124 domain-containing protein [Gammaproteobacteria bacterium]MBT8053503.1 DUF4124 domain-containing protein [Gammaproteobacteria bacterium]NND55871.1 DUF4124 domain-containing protein [Xanthomonadales bacterium]NNK50909.1 DUF4124 domain-containing protein [Xanthomonadales bacterium]